MNIDRKQYEKDLKQRQKEHLRQVKENRMDFQETLWQPCMHNQCTQCYGTGIRLDGRSCVHHIACPCPKCNPMCATTTNALYTAEELKGDSILNV